MFGLGVFIGFASTVLFEIVIAVITTILTEKKGENSGSN